MSEIQAIFQSSYEKFLDVYRVSALQATAASAILTCRTSALGGHKYECEGCGHNLIRYNSCRNRHCPSCQGIQKEIWIDQRKKDILEAPYFHVVFTLPKQLHMVVYQNQKLLYNLMYKAVAETLMELSADKKYLGAQIGFFSVLHTWGQNLHYHPHIHSVVLAGGLSKHNQWRQAKKDFFIPVRVLSKKFRGKFLDSLKTYYEQGQLHFYNETERYQESKLFQNLVNQCYHIDWYSYTKKTFSGPLAVVKYLGRYTHRIAISNQRILSWNEETVTIQAKDYKKNHRKTEITMKTIEFIRRFLMHILPKGFVKIRYYGLLANRNRKTKLALCRKLTNSRSFQPIFEGKSKVEVISILLKRDVTLCPECKVSHLKDVYSWTVP